VSQRICIWRWNRIGVATVPGGREPVRLQCTCEGVLWQLWCTWFRRQTVRGRRSIDGETSLPHSSLHAVNIIISIIFTSSSSSSTNFIATQVLKQNFRAAMCHVLHVLHYSCNVNAAVADSLHCRMICGTVPFSVHAWMPRASAATWSPATAHLKSLPRQRGRRDRQWSCATTVEHAATVTMQIADAYVTRCWRPAVAHCRDNVVLCRSYNGKLVLLLFN